MASALSYVGVAFAYPRARGRALDGIDVEVEAGDVVLVVGSSGSGKSTLLRAANGLVPHASGGRFAGDVAVHGRSTREHRPRDLVDVVGFVHQDPESAFVVDRVEDDVAFVGRGLQDAFEEGHGFLGGVAEAFLSLRIKRGDVGPNVSDDTSLHFREVAF